MARQTGYSVASYFPYWVVAERVELGDFVVVDTSVDPPGQVWGPGTEAQARLWAANTAKLFLATHGDYSDYGDNHG